MARWTQTWLTDLGTLPGRSAGEQAGKRLGLPVEGKGSVASMGVRLAAFLVDVLGSALIGRLIDPPPEDLETATAALTVAPTAVLLAVNVLGLALVGQTPGMRLFRIRVRPLTGDPARLSVVSALVRTALLSLLLPAVIFDRDRRGWHDRLSKAVVVQD